VIGSSGSHSSATSSPLTSHPSTTAKTCRSLWQLTCQNSERFSITQPTGKFLGIFFDTTTLSWKLPEEKAQMTLQAISEALRTDKWNSCMCKN
jgi:hypothetical protein